MWRAVTDDETGREAWDVIDEIDRCLVAHLAAAGSRLSARDPNLAGGTIGLALFFSYLDAARPGSDAGERALDALGSSIDALAARTMGASLYSGFCGVGWAIEHLTREFFEADDDLTAAIDDALAGYLGNPRMRMPYELIRGIAGFGTYLLERLPHPDAVRLLPRVLDHLEAGAEVTPGGGRTWHTHPEWIAEPKRALLPDGCYNLGLAHGVPGVLGFLAAAHRAGVDDPRVLELAEGAVAWLLSQRLPAGGDSAFPAFVFPGKPPEPTRTAWCYGDLGIAAALLSAARSFGRPEWEREALALARLAARRSEEAAGAIDACLCHGTAGNGHLFLRLYHATGDPVLKEAALEWLGRTLGLRRPGEEMAGYSSWIAGDRDGEGEWRADPGFLMGAAGVGLALLAAVTDVEPAWDRVMLVSVPPCPEVAAEGAR